MRTLMYAAMIAGMTVTSLEAAVETERAIVATRRMEMEQRRELFEKQEQLEEGDEQLGNVVEQLAGQTSRVRELREAGVSEEALKAAKGQVTIVYEYAPDVHYANTVGVHGEIVELEDGSTFVVRQRDHWRVSRWIAGDIVYVLPNHGYFFGLFNSGYDLCLYNPYTDEKVDVNLSAGPWIYGSNSTWVVHIDEYNGLIGLEDGTFVTIHPSDRYLLSNWEINDHLIIGTNDGGGRHTYPYVLIDVATLAPVRASIAG